MHMAGRWCIYILTLICAFVFFGAYTEYLSYYILMTVVLFPIFSLLVSLWGILSVRLRLFSPSRVTAAGEAGAALIEITSSCPVPVFSAYIEYETNDITFGQFSVHEKLKLFGAKRLTVPLRADFEHMGAVHIKIRKIRIYDLSGLFCFGIAPPAEQTVTVLPRSVMPVPFPALPSGELSGRNIRPQPGGGFAEEHDIRLYRIGDPINSVHWKLSAKLDELVVREPLISDKGVLAVFIDIFGTRDELEISFGKLLCVGRELIGRALEFRICFYGSDGLPESLTVVSESDLVAFFAAAFRSPIPEKGKSCANLCAKSKADSACWCWYASAAANDPQAEDDAASADGEPGSARTTGGAS